MFGRALNTPPDSIHLNLTIHDGGPYRMETGLLIFLCKLIDWFLYVRGLHLWNTQPQRNLQFLQNAFLAANLTKSSRGCNEPNQYSKNCIKHNRFGYSSEIPQDRKYSIYWKTSVRFYFFNFLIHNEKFLSKRFTKYKFHSVSHLEMRIKLFFLFMKRFECKKHLDFQS